MMTRREAQQRASMHGARIVPTGHGDYRVTLDAWSGKYSAKKIEAMAYYTDDLEDAALTCGKLKP